MGLDNPIHVAILLVLLLLVFGAKRLPELGRSLGEGMRGFKDSISGITDPAHADALTPTAAAAPPPAAVAQPVAAATPPPVPPPAPPPVPPAGA
jgi:sec-independent protein translocase protein TatA